MPDADHGATEDFHVRLEAAVERKARSIETESLPLLKSEFQRLHTSFRNFQSVIQQKGLAAEDPYKHAKKISEVSIPENMPIYDSDSKEEIGIRLSEYESQLDFLTSYYEFSLEFLSLKRIKLLADLAKFVNWASLSVTSSKSNTRTVAMLIAAATETVDRLTSQIVADSRRQMGQATAKILSVLKDLSIYHRESYKLRVRDDVISRHAVPDSISRSDVESMLTHYRKAFSNPDVSLPCYGDLVREIIVEDLDGGGEGAREELLSRLKVESKREDRVERVGHKPILLDALRSLASCAPQMKIAMDKLTTNSQYFSEQTSGRNGIFARWLRRMFVGNENKTRVYNVEFVDVATSVSKTERVDLDSFVVKGVRVSRSLAAYSNRMAPGSAQIEAAPDDEAFQKLESMIVEVQQIVRTIPALYEYFSSELSREARGKLRGVKLEVNAIQNSVVRANQARHDYVAKVEEEEQLRKLGIDSK